MGTRDPVVLPFAVTAPRYLIHDRDSIFAEDARRCLAGSNTEEVVTARRSLWQSPFVERLTLLAVG